MGFLMNSLEYKSFLLRVWREKNDLTPQSNWEAEIEHIQSGERKTFKTEAELFEFLHSTMESLAINKK